jgi:type II secretory pathway pseudopilin PulG
VVELLAVVTIVGTLAALAIPRTHDALERARMAQAIGDIRVLSAGLDAQDTLADGLIFSGPVRLDPWGDPGS